MIFFVDLFHHFIIEYTSFDLIKMKGAQRSNLRPNDRGNANQASSGRVAENMEHLLAHDVDILKEQFFVIDRQNNGFIQ